jgi:hypothetical protein
MTTTLRKTSPSATACGSIAQHLSRRLWFLEPARLCAEARHRTGLDDFGDPPLNPALTVLLDSLEQEAGLGPIGRFLMRVHLRDLLAMRLQLADAWRHNASALDAQCIEKPLFIVGMPRSGSTFLHELLADNPEHRAPRVWEVMFPVGSAADEARRIRKAAACLWWFRRLAPRADAVYPMRATTPHECVAIQSYTFLSEEFISTCRIPAYEAFLHATDLTPAYLWQKHFLQYLQLGSPAKRWVLKSPDHVHGFDALFAVFPDAVVVQTHRNPVEVVKSTADLTAVLQGLYGSSGDPEELRESEARSLAQSTQRFLDFRDKHPDLADRFVDVTYSALVSNPVETLRDIYARTGGQFSPAIAQRVERLASERSRYQGRRASADGGGLKRLSPQVTDCFKRYCSRFNLALDTARLDR